MDTKKALDKVVPFGALIAASSLIVALLFVAGFSYRWAYFYNFGIQDTVFDLSVQSFLIAAIELVRVPRNLLLSVVVILIPLIALNGILRLLRSAEASDWPIWIKKPLVVLTKIFGLEYPLTVDSLRAVLIVYTVYMLSSQFGYYKFKDDIIDSPHNPLPSVAVVLPKNSDDSGIVLSCGAHNQLPVNIVGDARKIRLIQEAFRTCDGRHTTWRLLYRKPEGHCHF